MKEQTKELLNAERRYSDFSYISEIIQRGRIRPSTYTHEIMMPVSLYEEMKDRGYINHGDNYTLQNIFFEFKKEEIRVSFMHLYVCEDFHHKIDQFLIVKAYGFYPIKRSGQSKMNFDRIVKDKSILKQKNG